MCESVIDEHFRRSLGADYMEIFKNKSNKSKIESPLASPVSPASEAPTELLLDLKKSPPSTPQPMDHENSDEINNENCENEDITNESEFKKESIEFSVDDHFAKALGDTWKMIKEQNVKPQNINLNSNSSSSDSNNRSNSSSPTGNNCNTKDSLRPCLNQVV